MENVSFTFEDAQRISDTVQAVERSKFATKAIDLTNQGDEFVIIYVSATTKYSDGSQNGNLSYWNETTHLFAQYSPTQTVRIRAANTADTLPVGYVFARFQGTTTRSDSSVGPLYIAVGSSASAGGAGSTFEVVTGVVCHSDGSGIGVTTASLTTSDFDGAVFKNFLGLVDVVPKSFVGNASRIVMVNEAANALEFGPNFSGAPTAADFLGLTDTPNTYSGASYKSVICNLGSSGTSTALVFATPNVTVTKSITGGGNPNDASVFTTLQLDGDVAEPGTYYQYCTNSSGVKGWYAMQVTPAGLSVGGQIVVSSRKAAVSDVAAHTISSADLATAVSTAQTAIDDLTTQVNLLLARIRSHGLISS